MTKQNLLHGVSLVAALLLAGCANDFANGPTSELDPEAAFPITVGPHMERLSIPSGEADAQARMASFAGAFIANGNGSITVSAPSAEVARGAADRLQAAGVPRNRIVMGGPSQNNTVELSYVGYGATSPACDNWSENLSFTLDNRTNPNFGCATAHNLAAQIADPRDLVSPQPMTPPDTERRMIVIDHWRKGEPTAAQKTAEQSGAVSEVAQH